MVFLSADAKRHANLSSIQRVEHIQCHSRQDCVATIGLFQGNRQQRHYCGFLFYGTGQLFSSKGNMQTLKSADPGHLFEPCSLQFPSALSCKLYGPRSDCILRNSLTRVPHDSVCFRDKLVWSAVDVLSRQPFPDFHIM